MSARLTIDSLRFARGSESLAGAFEMAELDRLADLRGSLHGSVDQSVRFTLIGQVIAGRPTLCVEVEAVLLLECQRCLGRFEQAVHVESRLPVARNDAEMKRWETEDPMLDVLLAEASLDVRALVEDEILLGLPLAPRHPEGMCGSAAVQADETN
jgi:uncharacterized protein